jgi:hypothetical protein
LAASTLTQRECATYLLYLDESGTHGSSPYFILSGLAVAEGDARRLQQRLTATLQEALPDDADPDEFELHATEIKSPARRRLQSPWRRLNQRARLEMLRRTYDVIGAFDPVDETHPPALFGVVVDRRWPDHLRTAYEKVLTDFDAMLSRREDDTGRPQTGFVIHDKNSLELDVQRAVADWREMAGRLGTLNRLADVPVFADSHASRLIQAADFVCWALWRYYGLPERDEQWIGRLWHRFDASDGVMHGLTHLSPEFPQCPCPPCLSRRQP